MSCARPALGLLLATIACTTPAGPRAEPAPAYAAPRGPEAEAREATARFLDAAERGDFQAVYALLAGPLRGRYTPQRLEADFRAEPLALERLRRVRAALALPFQLGEDSAALLLGGSRVFLLRREDGAWRVAQLE